MSGSSVVRKSVKKQKPSWDHKAFHDAMWEEFWNVFDGMELSTKLTPQKTLNKDGSVTIRLEVTYTSVVNLPAPPTPADAMKVLEELWQELEDYQTYAVENVPGSIEGRKAELAAEQQAATPATRQADKDRFGYDAGKKWALDKATDKNAVRTLAESYRQNEDDGTFISVGEDEAFTPGEQVFFAMLPEYDRDRDDHDRTAAFNFWEKLDINESEDVPSGDVDEAGEPVFIYVYDADFFLKFTQGATDAYRNSAKQTKAAK